MPSPVFFVGDIHLGRTPHRLLCTRLPASALGPEEAWRRVVRQAVQERAQAVVLAGDVVDQNDDRFEAFRPLFEGVRTLVDAGVRVLGVAGNHDNVALPLLSERIPDFVLLGRGGHWEHVALDGLDLIGWSFPAQHHSRNPLDSPGLQAALDACRSGMPAIAVLHADLDAVTSRYAPVSRTTLKQLPCTAVLAGHVHKPDDLTVPHPVGYLGSLVGLDRGEPGPRGPWRATLDAGGLSLEHVPLGPVAWHTLDVDVSDEVFEGEGALDALLSRTAALAATAGDALADMDAVGCTLRLVGRTSSRALTTRLMALDDGERVVPVGGASWVVVAAEDHTRPRLDLQAWAQDSSPLGQLARLYQQVATDGPEALPQEVAATLAAFPSDAWVRGQDAPPPPDPQQVALRVIAGLIDSLNAQRSTQEVV